MTEEDTLEGLARIGKAVGSKVVLIDGSKLQGSVLIDSKSFKGVKTRFRETHEFLFDLPGPKIYTISDTTTLEAMKQQKMSGHEKTPLDFSISKMRKSASKSLFIPSVSAEQHEAATENTSVSNRVRATEITFSLVDVEHGTRTVITHAEQASSSSRNDFEQGWVCYPKHTNYDRLISLPTCCELHSLLSLGNQNKHYRTSSDCAQDMLLEAE